MVELRRTGRTPHELVEVAPETLDCGHPCTPGRVTVGFDSPTPDGERVRTYRCGECGAVTFSPPA